MVGIHQPLAEPSGKPRNSANFPKRCLNPRQRPLARLIFREVAGPFYSRGFCMSEATRNQIVKAILDEMKAKVLAATPETRASDDASILYLSGVLATFTMVPINPEQVAFGPL